MHFINIEKWLHKELSCPVCNLIKEGKFYMNMVKIDNSSNIAEIGYDGASQTLHIRFLSGGLYQYDQVPVVLHMQLMAAKSKGHYLSKHVKNNPNFPCRKLDEVFEYEKETEVLVRATSVEPQHNIGHGIVDTSKLPKQE